MAEQAFTGLMMKENAIEISIAKECREIKAVCDKYGEKNND